MSKKRTSKRADSISDAGFAKFLQLFRSLDPQGIISLGVGEPDFDTPQGICHAGIGAIESGRTRYTPTEGTPELRRAIARDLEQRHGIAYDPQTEIAVTVGSSQGIDLACRTILDPGDEVILSNPYYFCHVSCIRLAGGIPVTVPTRSEDNFQLQLERIEASITPSTKLLILNYPANPTGTCMSREALTEIGRLVAKRDLLVISDEIYSRFTYDRDHICFATLPEMKERTITIDGFSKTYAMTGWRLGYLAGPADLIGTAVKIYQHTTVSPPSISQVAALEALENGEDQIKEMVAQYDRRRRVIFQALNRMGLTCSEPEGAFYIFPSIQSTGMTSHEFTEQLLLQEKVVVMPGTLFGEGGEGFIRCCYTKAMPEIEEALTRMERFLEKQGGRA